MPIHTTIDDHVVTITIDRPARRNALDMEHFDALAEAWKSFRDDRDAWVAVVTGVDDAFCAGGDLRDYLPLLTAAYSSGSPGDRDRFRSGTEAVLRDLDIYKPIIAAVNGPCVAGGMELLNGTDLRLACPEAVFGMLEPKRGIFASGGRASACLVRSPGRRPWSSSTPPRPSPRRARSRWACSTRSCRARGSSTVLASGRPASPRTRRSRWRRPRRARSGR
jgi:enoyl-CoA hydratase